MMATCVVALALPSVDLLVKATRSIDETRKVNYYGDRRWSVRKYFYWFIATVQVTATPRSNGDYVCKHDK
jgi:hypothetical protein